MAKKVSIKQTSIKVDMYRVLTDCVERGIQRGWHRAHKHTDQPLAESVQDEISNAVMGEVCEYFKFEEVNNG